MVYTALGSVTSSGTITKAWGDQVNTNFESVKPRILQPNAQRFDGSHSQTYLGTIPGEILGTSSLSGQAYHALLIPADYAVLTKAVLRGVSLESGNIAYAVQSSRATPGDVYSANETPSTGNITLGVTANQIIEIDLSAQFSGIAANQTLGLGFFRQGSSTADTVDNFVYISLDVEYTP